MWTRLRLSLFEVLSIKFVKRRLSKMHCFKKEGEVGGEKVVNSFPSIGG